MVLLIITKHLNTLKYNYVDSNSKRERHRCLLLSCLLPFFLGSGASFWFFFFDRNGKEGHECQFVFAGLSVNGSDV